MDFVLNIVPIIYLFLWFFGTFYGYSVGILEDFFGYHEYSEGERRRARIILAIVNLPLLLIWLWSELFYGHHC